jgi:hypothetical protein
LESVKKPIWDVLSNSVAVVGVYGGADANVVSYGGVDCFSGNRLGGFVAASDLSPSVDTIADFLSFIAPLHFPDQIDTTSLDDMEADVPWALLSPPISFALSSRSFNLLKEPFSYSEAISRPDASVWRAAMDRELTSLGEMGAFVEADLPKGERAIGLKWVYTYKKDANSVNIVGKEKARVVAQGFSQRPGQFDETYAPVAKMASVQILLTWAAVHDLEIYQFDCKTAFLHAKIRHPNTWFSAF